MVIRLDEATIDQALPLVSVGLDKYCRLQAALAVTDARDRGFQIQFNGFYKVRRNAAWQSVYYELLQREKSGPQPFSGVLRALHAGTRMVEASFASKLSASVDPNKPVIDSFVLKNLGLRLPRFGEVEARLSRIIELYDQIERIYACFLDTDIGRYLTTRFAELYPEQRVTRVKMLDLVLWQTRDSD